MPNIRPASSTDATGISLLLTDLGYPSSVPEVEDRLARLAGLSEHALFIAELDGEAAGLCQVQGIPNIAGDGYAEIHALVVAEAYQRRGIGRKLVARAGTWANATGYGRLRLRSGVHREDAHTFYVALGFAQAKASFAFEIASSSLCEK